MNLTLGDFNKTWCNNNSMGLTDTKAFAEKVTPFHIMMVMAIIGIVYYQIKNKG